MARSRRKPVKRFLPKFGEGFHSAGMDDEISSAAVPPNSNPKANRITCQLPCQPANSVIASKRLSAAAAMSRRNAILREVRKSRPTAAPRQIPRQREHTAISAPEIQKE